MAIHTAGEFDIVLTDITFRLDRMLNDQPRHAPLIAARRQLGILAGWVRKQTKIGAREMMTISATAEAIRSCDGDPELDERLHDLLDYLERHHKLP